MNRSVLLRSAACAALSLPPAAPAQTAGDTALLSLPPAAALRCESESGLPPGVRGYSFGVGAPSREMRTSSGQRIAAGPPPREIAAVFDTAGRPALLVDIVRHGVARQVAATVRFDSVGTAAGIRQSIDTDSAAVLARVEREGLDVLQAAIRDNTRAGPAEALDPLSLRRARTLADYLWGKRCP